MLVLGEKEGYHAFNPGAQVLVVLMRLENRFVYLQELCLVRAGGLALRPHARGGDLAGAQGVIWRTYWRLSLRRAMCIFLGPPYPAC
jgi:hypothetical protein